MQPPKVIDYHLHTAVTIDGLMTETEVCERALSLGIQEIAFTNHVMLNQPDYTMSPATFMTHWKEVQDCRQRYSQLKIRMGIEMDYYIGREQEIAASLRSYEEMMGCPFDIVLGAIHEVNSIFFSNKHQAPKFYGDRDIVSLYCDYFILITKAVRSRLFDIIAHPDLIKKYTHVLTPPVAFDSYRATVEPFIDALLELGVGIEVNTKGLKLKVNEAYPSNEFLKLYLSKTKSSGMEPILTLGSDAHKVDDVGSYLLEGAMILHNLGVNNIVSFDQRVKSIWEM